MKTSGRCTRRLIATGALWVSLLLSACGGSGGLPDGTLSSDDSPPPVTGATYYLDANAGDDANDGSQAKPWRTFKKALASVRAGDLVLMNSGNYGTLVAGRTKDQNLNYGDWALPRDEFSDWVTFKAAPGQEPHVTKVDFGTLNTKAATANRLSVQLAFSVKGQCDVYIHLEGLVIEDGVNILGCRHITIKNSKIHRVGDLSGSVSNLDNKAGVSIMNGQYITLARNEITHTSIGIAAATYDLRVLRNEIHHNSHDGLRVWGGDNWLIEGNRIHDLDDGVDDEDATNLGINWNRHSDGIQIWTLKDVTNNVTIRGNLFYHIEAMGIMFQQSDIPDRRFANWTVENNIFGPVGGSLLHFGTTIDGQFTYRHNTILYAPQDAWTSIYPTNLATGAERRMTGQRYHVAWWPGCTGEAYIYNNIFADGSQAKVYSGLKSSFSGHNLYRLSTGRTLSRGEFVSATLPYPAINGNIQDDIEAHGIPGVPGPTSAAIDAGTRIGSDAATRLPTQLDLDFNSGVRDVRPDLGAFEVQGRTPPAEVFAR